MAERIVKPMSKLTSFTDDLRDRGLSPRSEFLERDIGEVTPEESMAMTLSPGAWWCGCIGCATARTSRWRSSAAWCRTAFCPIRLVKDSLYEVLETLGLSPARGRCSACARVNLMPNRRGCWTCAEGSAGLALERRTFIADGRLVEYTRSWYRGDTYDFVAELQTD